MAAAATVKKESITIRIQFNSEYRISAGNGPVIVNYKTHMDEPLRRIFLDFCDHLALVYSEIRFTYEGDRIRETDTPNRFKMEDGDLIDAFTGMLGGGAAAAAAAQPFI